MRRPVICDVNAARATDHRGTRVDFLLGFNPQAEVTVRVRITSRLRESIDGISLRRFEAGEVYDVGTSLGNYLMACGHATPVVEEQPSTGAVASPLQKPLRCCANGSVD